MSIRVARREDAESIAAIYRPSVTDSVTSFEAVPPDAAEMWSRVEARLARTPWLVLEEGGVVQGYAYAGLHRERVAYQWSAESSVYVAASAQRRGVGRRLYTALFEILRLQGYVNVYAGITLPNAASVALHESFGFEPVGVYRRIGFKFGRWHDVGWWQVALRAHPAEPLPPRPLAEVLDDPAVREVLSG